MYTLQSIELLIRYALNYGMGTDDFIVECDVSSGFQVTFKNEDKDYFQVINTYTDVKLYLQPEPKIHGLNILKEYSFETIDNNIYAFKGSFDSWIRELYQKEKMKVINSNTLVKNVCQANNPN